MPYANKAIADRLDNYPAELPTSMGELSYVLTRVAVSYLGSLGRPLKAKDLGDVIAALETTKLEFYRRVVGPYEQLKCEQNGDCYWDLPGIKNSPGPPK